MTKAQRRPVRGRTRSRRVPAPSAPKSGRNIPRAAIIVLAGVAAVVGLIVYLIIQSNQPPGDDLAQWAEVEADAAPDLPGIYVDLPTIYDGSYGQHGDNATARHVERDVDYVEDGNTIPPTGGPHWGNACADNASDSPPFCGPAQWGIYEEPWDAETLVHNMEHGGVVVWYNTDDEDVVTELQDIVRNKLNDGDIIVMAPFPEMEEDTIALTAWTRLDSFPISEFSSDRVEEFFDIFVRRFNPEGF